VLQRREPFYDMSARVLAAAETGMVEGWVAAHSINTLFYLLARYQSVERAPVALTDLLTFLSVAAIDHLVIEQALNLPYPDFEDAVQMMAAVRSGVQYLALEMCGLQRGSSAGTAAGRTAGIGVKTRQVRHASGSISTKKVVKADHSRK
jgi:hypothetical protein